jgi:gamma-glutamylcyclotransferase (GGCT)/AIG2-like uncharacterized protein YtfP
MSLVDMRRLAMMADNKHSVLIYGELRLGFWKDYILNGATHLGTGRTCEHYALYVASFPYAMRHESRYPIVGEIFRVNEKTLEHLDLLQGHPYWYRRLLVPIEVGEDRHDAWVYFGQDPVGELLPSGDYLKYCESAGGRVAIPSK